MKLTALPDRIVRRARTHPRGTAERNVRPSRISSLIRSKNMTNESAVMPMPDEPGDAGEVEGEADPPAEQHQDPVHDHAGEISENAASRPSRR